MIKRSIIAALSLCLMLFFVSTGVSAKSLMMATTTSTDNTGLLDYLAPKFEEDTGITLKWTAVGTGKALELGKNCDVDVLLVHAPPAEKEYVKNGYGSDRTEVMYNDFVIIGPKDDPAGIKGMDVNKALETIADAEELFVSRGDDSGTNKKELGLWQASAVSIPEKAEWYLETGQGMLSTIRVAEERGGYTMTDRGTYIKYADNFEGNPPLHIQVEGDKELFNQYSVMAVNTNNCPNAQYDLAKEFIRWITSDKTQETIADFRLLGKKLFNPNAE